MKYLKAIVSSSLFLVLAGCGTAQPKPVLINGQYHMPYKKKIEISNKGKIVNIHGGEAFLCSVEGKDTIKLMLHIANDASLVYAKILENGKKIGDASYIKNADKDIWIEHNSRTGVDEAFGILPDHSKYIIITNYKENMKKEDRKGITGQCRQASSAHPQYKYITKYRPMSDQELAIYIHNKEQAQRNSDKINKSLDDLNDDMKENNRQLNNMYQQNLNRNNTYNIRIVK